jgi:uncharacterized protein YcfL
MTNNRKLLFCVALMSVVLAGCSSGPTSGDQLDTTKYTIESTGKFVLLDQSPQICVKCTGLQERMLPDGRLEVVANVKNLEKRLLDVQIDCVFKDERGIPSEEERPLRKIKLAEGSTQAVPFISANTQARKYTIRVREVE